MNELYRDRREGHFVSLLKYWRLVFNDHFVIALFFLLGALAYSYAGWLPHLTGGQWWAPPVLAIWFTLVAQLGRFATLLKPADRIFLLPKSSQMGDYLRGAWWLSLLLGELITIAGIVVALPMATITLQWHNFQWLMASGAMILAEANWFILAKDQLNFNSRLQRGWRRWVVNQWVETFLIVSSSWIYHPLGGLVFAVVLLFVNSWVANKPAYSLEWNAAIALENHRMEQLYRFFNLFTDVPSVTGRIARRRWADRLVKGWTITNHPWSYLFVRGFVRDTEMSGLAMRLTAVAMVVVFFIPLGWLKCVLSLLFIYLLAGELTPFYHHFDNNAMVHLLAVGEKVKLTDFQSLCRRVLVLATTLIAVANLGFSLRWQWAVISLVVGLLLAELLVRLMPRRLKKR
ncbi:ABC transporter permease [uncultured Limosilactobacillus sp.]|uniref:ABC transporter permease n=1 Tax=uncultured Limosilactobacillus sp. TaxID=2837629 RepID=UPI0025D59664|nr:ABC transporter permease [uncultured Limosilactobacillus sp.]